MRIQERFESPDPLRRLLMIQLGDIGDIVWTIPTLLSVHAAWPGTALSLLVHRGFGDLLRIEPYLDRVFEVPDAAGGFERLAGEMRLVCALRKERFDGVIDLRAGDRGAFMARLTGAPVRAALWNGDASFLRNRMFTHLVQPVHENIRRSYGAAEQSLRIVRGLGVSTEEANPVLHVSPQALAAVRRLLERLDPSLNPDPASPGGFYTLNPFSRWAYKEWALEKWVRVMTWLATKGEGRVVIVGSISERERAAALVRKCAGLALNMAGETSLSELAALLSLSRLHIGVDSAAPHIAAAVGVPTVTLYGPSDWRDWAPVGDRHRVVASDMDCVPCRQKGCNGQGRSLCLERLSVEQVTDAIKSAVLPRRSA